MKIVVDNSGYALNNLGDVAMLQAALSRISSLWPDAEISVATTAPKKLRSINQNVKPLLVNKPDNRIRAPWILPWFIYNILPNKAKWLIAGSEYKLFQFFSGWLKNTFHAYNDLIGNKLGVDSSVFITTVKQADIIIITGGGFLTDSWTSHGLKIMKTIQSAENAKIIGVFGQGIGPVTNRELLKSFKQLTHANLICLRESRKGIDILEAAGVKKECIRVTGDDAIGLAYNNKTDTNRDCIGINIRIANYSGVSTNDSKNIVEILIKASQTYNAQLLGVPVSRAGGDSDVLALQRLFANTQLSIDHGENVKTVEQLIKQVSQCRFIVTGSYHAGVFALSQGIPVIALAKSSYYEDKFMGLADMFKAGCFVLMMEADTFIEDFQDAIKKVWNSDEQLRNSLLNEARLQIDKSIEAYQELAKISQSLINNQQKN